MPNANLNRILLEGAAIVASILLAFAIDAWWEQRAEDAEARMLIDGMRTEFEASQREINDKIKVVNNIHAANERFLQLIRQADIGEEIEVPFAVIVGVLGAPTYSPTDATLRTAMAIGNIGLIDDHELAGSIALWRQQLDDTSEDEILARQLVVTQLMPELSRQLRLAGALEYDRQTGLMLDDPSAAAGEAQTLRVTTELEAILAHRHFFFTFVVDGLAGIRETQARILERLEDY